MVLLFVLMLGIGRGIYASPPLLVQMIIALYCFVRARGYQCVWGEKRERGFVALAEGF